MKCVSGEDGWMTGRLFDRKYISLEHHDENGRHFNENPYTLIDFS